MAFNSNGLQNIDKVKIMVTLMIKSWPKLLWKSFDQRRQVILELVVS